MSKIHEEFNNAVAAIVLKHGDDIDGAAAEYANELSTSGSVVDMAKRKIRVYYGARERSKAFGLVGVGCTTFAENRVAEFMRRVSSKMKGE